MRVLLQRVKEASVVSDGELTGEIKQGILVLVGIEEADGPEDIEWLCRKITQVRIFADEEGVMNKSVLDIGGEVLVVSQFTLHASTKKGNRPSYIRAAKPPVAIPLYEQFLQGLKITLGKTIPAGVFGADMQVRLHNDGPVTLWIDSKNRE
jgi:D-tyrosyl-tRNA(Tyr) deacylase